MTSRAGGWLRETVIWAVLCHAGSSAFGQAIRTDTPESTIEALHAGLIEAARDRSADVRRRYEALRPVILATHDLPFIAEFTIRRQWASLTADERQRFVSAFETLSVMTYASRFTNATDATFDITGGMPADSGRFEITATIARPEGGPVPLEYLLHEKDGHWRIINIVADGVSDLALKRAEYQRIVADGSIDDLIRNIEEQTARLE
jgi:phospholipid transport system substrate-binding protein